MRLRKLQTLIQFIKDSPTKKANYRPLTVLRTLCKSLRGKFIIRLIQSKMPFLDYCSKGKTNLIVLTISLLICLGFMTVWNMNVLLQDLWLTLLMILLDYLASCKQHVKMGSSFSIWFDTKKGAR